MKKLLVAISLVLVISTSTLAHRSRSGSRSRSREGSSKCDFNQLAQFLNGSSCLTSLYNQLLQKFPKDSPVDEDHAKMYCTQNCVGNLLEFLQEKWRCKKAFKKSYPIILQSLCSKNDVGNRCISTLRSSNRSINDRLEEFTRGSVCSEEHLAYLEGLVESFGCCFQFKFGRKIEKEPEKFCDIEIPALCTVNYERNSSTMTMNNNDTSFSIDGVSSKSRTNYNYSTLLLFCVFVSLSCLIIY